LNSKAAFEKVVLKKHPKRFEYKVQVT